MTRKDILARRLFVKNANEFKLATLLHEVHTTVTISNGVSEQQLN